METNIEEKINKLNDTVGKINKTYKTITKSKETIDKLNENLGSIIALDRDGYRIFAIDKKHPHIELVKQLLITICEESMEDATKEIEELLKLGNDKS